MPITLDSLLTVAGVAAFVLLVTQVLKTYLPPNYVPLLAAGLGVLASLGAAAALGHTTGAELTQAALTGLVGGWTAVGAFEAQKPTGVLPPRTDSDGPWASSPPPPPRG